MHGYKYLGKKGLPIDRIINLVIAKKGNLIPFYKKKLHISDVDECVDSPCGDSVPCINVEGSYSCRCLPGWSGQNCTEGQAPCLCYSK